VRVHIYLARAGTYDYVGLFVTFTHACVYEWGSCIYATTDRVGWRAPSGGLRVVICKVIYINHITMTHELSEPKQVTVIYTCVPPAEAVHLIPVSWQ
jgi:hypothetical protein